MHYYYLYSISKWSSLLLCFGIAAINSFAQTTMPPLAQIIATKQQNKAIFETYRPFDPAQKGNFDSRRDIHTYLGNAVIMDLNLKTLHEIMNYRDEEIRLSLPMPNGENITLLLFKAQVLTDNFKLTTHSQHGEQTQTYMPGVYYRGIVEQNHNSVAAFSFFDNGDAMGMFSTDAGNYIIGKLNDQSKQFIIYNDRDLLVANPFVCQVKDETIKRTIPSPTPNIALKSSSCGKLVRTYLECDYELYTAKNANVATTTNYATGMYNNVATLYQNESISTQTSEVYVWTTADSYPVDNPNAILAAFGTLRQDSFNGDLAHLLSGAVNASGYSGLAWVDVLCSTYWAVQQSGRFAYSNIAHSYQAVPTYSWTIGCVVHEMGHNLGSPHTHSCCWSGGALDNCVAVETCNGNSCSQGPAPTNGGTIMSYCHITANGVNFNNGFGTQPGNLIRSNVNTATCLSGDIPPVAGYNHTPVSGLNVSFTATATGTNNTYSWAFGDAASGASNTATGATATHNFTAAGTYTISLTVTNDCGTDTETQSIIVSNYTPPVLCSGAQTISTCSGTITDGSSGVYNNNMSCTWLIAPANATSVSITFTNFNTEQDYDFVRVYNGSNASAPLLGQYSGSSLPGTLTANSGQMFVRFTSDVTITSDGFSANYSCTAPTPTGNRLLVKAFLEGAYNTSSNAMNSTLNAILPTTQPYNIAPWNYNGTESIATSNSNIVDWVLIELRQTSDNSLVSRKAALLHTNGNIYHTDGIQGVDFGTLSGSYYVVLRHRNHLPIISANAVTLPNITAYDFSNVNTQVQGGNTTIRDVNGVRMIKTGDFDSNGILNYADYNVFMAQFLSGNSNYVSSDANFDNNLTTADFDIYFNNLGAMTIPLLRY